MHDLPTTNFSPERFHGARVASQALRRSQSEDFLGLEEGADRYGLLVLVKRAGRLAGFTPAMIGLLDYYLAYTREDDWRAGSRPIVFQSVTRTAMDLGVTERQVQKLEAALFKAGALTWNDSGNHRRYGHRCPDTGRIVYAFGVDLSPLARLRGKLEAILDAKRRHDEAWRELKRQVSGLRAEARGLLAEWGARPGADRQALALFAEEYDAIATPIRSHVTLQNLETLAAAHQSLVERVREAMGVGGAEVENPPPRRSSPERTSKGSPTDEPSFAPYNSSTHEPTGSCSPGDRARRGSVAAGPATERLKPRRPAPKQPSPGAGMEHVTLAMALGAAGPRLRERLPPNAAWSDLVEAAYGVRGELGISQASWGEACGVLGRGGAAVALLVTERAAARPIDPVRTPAAYFRGLVARAERGQLRLERSLFGLLERDGRGC